SPKSVSMFDAAEFEWLAVQFRHQVCSQDRGIRPREGFVELLRFAELTQLHPISQGRQVVKDDREFIDLQAIVDDNRIRTQSNDNRTIVRTSWYRMSLERIGINHEEHKEHEGIQSSERASGTGCSRGASSHGLVLLVGFSYLFGWQGPSAIRA